MSQPCYELEKLMQSTRTVEVHSAVRCGARGFRRAVSALSVPATYAQHGPANEAFAAAAAAFARLQHPSLAAVEDVWESNGRPWAAVAPLVGSPLARLLEVPASLARPLCPRVASELVLSVAEAAGALSEVTKHSALGEISADSVWVLPEGRPVLLPCGGLNATGSLSEEAALTRYRAPEAAHGVALGASADVYSLALLLWDLIALGRSQRGGDTDDATHATPARVDQSLVKLVMRSLSASPSDRPRDARVFHDELARFVSSEPPSEPDEDATVELATVEFRSSGRSPLSAMPPLVVMPAPVRKASDAARPPACSRPLSPRLEPSRIVSVGVSLPGGARSRQLRVVRGDGAAGALLLEGPARRWVIGRARSADLVICDPDMSREHFEVVEGPNGEYRLYDLGSKNGLFVNGTAADQHALRSGDEVRAGETLLRFEP